MVAARRQESWPQPQPVIADCALSFEGSDERAWLEGREVHPCGLEPPEEDVELKLLWLKGRWRFASFSTEIRFTGERGKHLAQQIGLEKRPAPHSLNPVIEKDSPKYLLFLMWSPSRKAEPLRKAEDPSKCCFLSLWSKKLLILGRGSKGSRSGLCFGRVYFSLWL